MPQRCCGTSVGVLIQDEQSRVLMIERGWWPLGIAPVAGHVYDAHTDAAQALVAEVREEVGLQVTGAKLLWEGHLPNRCASLPADPPGHYWWVYRASATGTLTPAAGETKGAAWYTLDQLNHLAARTLEHARGATTTEEFAAKPGLEAVWCELLARVVDVEEARPGGRLVINGAGRDLRPYEEPVRDLYTQAPPQYWKGGRSS